MTQDPEIIQALMVARTRQELRRARRAFVLASVIAGATTILAAWGWLR
jgi:hypothetical protein